MVQEEPQLEPAPRRSRMSRLSKLYRNAVLFNIVTILLILGVFEVSARVFMNYNTTFKERFIYSIEYAPSGFSRYRPLPNQSIYEVGESTVWSRMGLGAIQYENVKYRLNPYGFRGEDFPIHKQRDEIRVAILGGSHVFDTSSNDYEGNFGFPQVIQDYFEAEPEHVSVINAGLPGADTRDIAQMIMLDLHRYEPDYVIVNSIWNDTKWISRTDSSTLFLLTPPRAVRPNPMQVEVTFWDRVFGFSTMYRKARDYYWRKKLNLGQSTITNEGVMESASTDPKDFSVGLDQYEKNIVGAVQMIRSIGATPILAIEERFVSPHNSNDDKKRIGYFHVNIRSHEELVRLFYSCDSILRNVAKELDVYLIDANQEMEGDPKLFVDHIHTTPQGSEHIARHYFNFLKSLINGNNGP